MKSYTTPELTYKKFREETIIAASGLTNAEKQLREKMTGNDFNINKNNIVTVTW